MTQFDEPAARREFQRDPALQAEFGTLDVYTAYARGVASGRIRPPVVGRTVTAEPEPPPRREVDEQASPSAPRVSSAAQRRRRQEVDNRSAAQRQAAPDLRAIWDQHGPQSGRIQCSMLMNRFGSFEEFEKHVASHSREVTTHGR